VLNHNIPLLYMVIDRLDLNCRPRFLAVIVLASLMSGLTMPISTFVTIALLADITSVDLVYQIMM